MKFKANQRILNGMLMKEIKDLNATIRRHGEAHLAQDLLPQFTDLVKNVEKLEGQLNFKLNDGPIHNHSVRIEKLESDNAKLWKNIGDLEIKNDLRQNDLKIKSGRPRKP